MRALGWIAVVGGCQAGDTPRVAPAPAPVIAPALVRDAAASDASLMAVDAAAPPPADEVLAAVPMAGPFASRAKLCAAQVCAPDTQSGPTPIARTVACPTTLPDELTGTQMAAPPAKFSEVFLQAISCLTPGDRFDDNGSYHVVVHRADGYYLSAPIVSINSNPKYCDVGLVASWQARDAAIVLGVTTHKDCLTCDKQGSESDGVEILAVIADGPVPVTFLPLITAQHHHQKPTDRISADTVCPVVDRDVTLSPSWDQGKLVLRGAATWARPFPSEDGSISAGAFEGESVASAAGTYRLALP